MFFVSGQFGITLMSYGTNQVSAYVGIFNAILLALFIYATAAATGGHVNPMISFATMLCGFTPVSRGERHPAHSHNLYNKCKLTNI